MDFNSSAKKKKKEKEARSPTPHRGKTSGRTKAEVSAGNQVSDSRDRQRPSSKPELSLEKKIELEKQRRHLLIKEHNRLMFAVKQKEAKLKQLQEILGAKDLQQNNEIMLEQRLRQLTNNLDKMKMKITAARNLQKSYAKIHEHLQQECCGLSKRLKQKERQIAARQAEVEKAATQLQPAAAADSTQMIAQAVKVVLRTGSALTKIDQTDQDREKNLKRMEALQRRLRELDFEEEEEEEEEEEGEGEEGEEEGEAHSSPVKDLQGVDICGIPQSDMKLVEDMEALREALGCADVQDLVNKVTSQRATRKHLSTELAKSEELLTQEARTLADLESQYTELKFGAKHVTTSFDRLKEEMQARLKQEVERVQCLQAELKRSQDLLDTVEFGINNLYFRMSCVPVEGLPSVPVTDSMDKLKDISARLPTLLQRASEKDPEINALNQEKLYTMLEKRNMMEPRNNKSTTPIVTVQLSDDDEDACPPSREDIKSSSMQLVESNKKKVKKSAKKRH